MIYGDSNIRGMERILNINPKFIWNDVKYIEKIEYYIDLNEYAEKVSNMNILFLIELPDETMHKLYIKFYEINNLKLYNIGGKYNQIMGFEIVNQTTSGWDQDQEYVVRDYENGTIEFTCKTFEISQL